MHLGAIAKTALRFSFLKFKARNNLQLSQPDDPIDAIIHESSSTVPVTNGYALKEEASENKSINSERGNSIPLSIMIDATESVNIERNLQMEKCYNKEANKNLNRLEIQISRIESQLLECKRRFDLQMNTLLDLLKDLKVDLEGNEIIGKVDSQQSQSEIEPALSDPGIMTSSI